jgi:hypothetical protein
MAVHLRTISAGGTSLAWSQGRSVTVDARPASGALRVGFDALELLSFAVGAAYIDIVLNEAARRRLNVRQLAVDVSHSEADGLSVSIGIETDADENAVMDLVEHADRNAPVSNLLRLGAPVRLAGAHVIRE